MTRTNVFWGKVTSGKKRGKGLGFPTANINLHKKIKEGIYISQATLNKKNYPALTFIGMAKTFGEKDINAETYFLTFNGNIYGKWVSVRLLRKIRENQKFESAAKLALQMKKDRKEAEKYFKIGKYV
jgi:riboflavin kinase/FMN adenylyltransferase